MNAYFTLNNLFYDKQYGLYHFNELAALSVLDAIINHMDNGNTPIHLLLSTWICRNHFLL